MKSHPIENHENNPNHKTSKWGEDETVASSISLITAVIHIIYVYNMLSYLPPGTGI